MKKIALPCLIAFVLAGCNTANPFTRMAPDYTTVPQDALMRVATEVETVVLAGDPERTVGDDGGVVVSSPAVAQAIRSRALRTELVQNLLDSRYAVEKPNGLIALEGSREYKDATTRRERDRDALVVLSENENRWAIYEGIMKASNFPSKSLSAIQDAFYTARVAQMTQRTGYETPEGDMVVVGG